MIEQLDPNLLREARLGAGELSEATLEGHLAVPPTAAGTLPPTDAATPRSAAPSTRGVPRVPLKSERPRPPFESDYQAFMGHQVLKALVAQGAQTAARAK